MVGTVDFIVDAGGLNVVGQSVGNDEVVDAPACVLFACMETV